MIEASSKEDEHGYYLHCNKKRKQKKRVSSFSARKREPFEVSDEEESMTEDDEFEGQRSKAKETSFSIPFIPENDKKFLRQVDKIVALKDRLYLVKWRYRSHLFDTWENEETIRSLGGGRKLENFICDTERGGDNDIDVEELKVVERVLDEYHDEESGSNYYLCKWMGSAYSECTWEPIERIKDYIMLVDEYLCIAQSEGIPPCSKTLNRRCTFRKLSQPPEYIAKHGILRDYQLEGVNWLLYSWCRGTNVILADEMGLGKTIQTIAYISALYHEYNFTGPVLVVVPLSTIAAWQREFARWAPTIMTLLYIGDSRSRGVQRFYEWFAEELDESEGLDNNRRRSSINAKPNPLFHVLLTTYELVLKDRQFLEEIDWRMLIVDEGHRLKNFYSQLHEVLDQVSPTSRLLVTGTPLQNSMMELWSLLHFLMPNKFPDYKEFLEKYGPPGGDNEQDADKQLEKLHKILKPHLLRRMKKDVETSLPGKTECILRVELNENQKHLSRLVITKNYRELISHTKSIGSLNNILFELKKVCNHPLLLGQTNNTMDDVKTLNEVVRSSAKMILLDQLLTRLHRDGHRVLIFSQMVKMLDILADYLCLKGYSFQRLDGSTSSEVRKKSIASFNAPGSEDFCFLLSTRAGGLGINLETADTVVIYDSDWNPQNDLQAMARAHRIGQKKSVNIYRLVSKGSVEETILERAKKKMVLDHLVIQSMDTSAKLLKGSNRGSTINDKKISRDELQAILKFGAQELFKAEVDGDPKVDLDEILSRADKTNSDPGVASAGGASQFFDQFKVADFGWDEIIPANVVEQSKREIEEEEQKKKDMVLQEALFTSASKRKSRQMIKRQEVNDMAMAESASDRKVVKNSLKSRTKASKTTLATNCKKEFDDNLKLTKTVTRSLLTSLLKFGVIEERFAAILKDVRDATKDEMLKWKEENLLHAMRLFKRKIEGKEDSCKTSNLVHVNLSQLRERHCLLQYLHDRLGPHYPDRLDDFVIKEKGIKSVATMGDRRWMVSWTTPEDDAKLLIGVYRHGFGQWKEIANDEELGLKKLLESIVEKKNEATFLPKELHLGRRVENVLNHMMWDKPSVGPTKKAKVFGERPAMIQEKSEDESEIKDLKKSLKPVREDLAFLASLTSETFSSNLDRITDSLYTIGMAINRGDAKEADRLWRYISGFWPTEISGRELKHFWNRITKERKSPTATTM